MEHVHRLQTAIEALVIGASAGGIDAVERLLAALPARCRLAVFVVLHLPAGRPSRLAQIFSGRCALPVVEPLDKQPVVPGTVYVAPPDYHMLVEPDRTVALSVDAPILYSRPAIDPLFESAAVAYGPALLAVVLTGASADGSAGLRAVRRAGGTAWIQDPASALARTMPDAALAAAGADAVLSIDEIAQRLEQMATVPLVPTDAPPTLQRE